MEINKKIRRLADDLLRSRFEITKEIITHSSSNADIILMNLPVVGNIKILVVYREKEIKKQIKSVTCDFLRSYDDADDPCILIKGGWFGSHICGEGIITLNSMG